jgi:hypothetical protein
MNIEKFIVTIQWGKGLHYIVSTCTTEKRVQELITFHRKRCDNIKLKKSRGSKAIVRSWKLLEEK